MVRNAASSKSKYWVFTLNNYTDDELDQLSGLVEAGKASYLICGRETGASGTPHIQGYIEFGNRKMLATVKNTVAAFRRAHFEPRRGTQLEAITYSKKDGSFTEYGTPSPVSQGRRSDLDKVVESVKSGATVRELWAEHPTAMIRYMDKKWFKYLINKLD